MVSVNTAHDDSSTTITDIDGTNATSIKGTVPKKAHTFTDTLKTVNKTLHSLPMTLTARLCAMSIFYQVPSLSSLSSTTSSSLPSSLSLPSSISSISSLSSSSLGLYHLCHECTHSRYALHHYYHHHHHHHHHHFRYYVPRDYPSVCDGTVNHRHYP